MSRLHPFESSKDGLLNGLHILRCAVCHPAWLCLLWVTGEGRAIAGQPSALGWHGKGDSPVQAPWGVCTAPLWGTLCGAVSDP